MLRAGRLAELDLENLTQEVEGLADVKRSAVLNNAAAVIEHLLKLQHSPATIRARLARLGSRATSAAADRLDAAPPSDPEPTSCRTLYAMARDDASAALRDHGEDAAADALPRGLPLHRDQITGDWLP